MATKQVRKSTIKNYLSSLPAELQEHVVHLDGLLDGFPPEISLSFLFSKIETAHNMIVYCAIVKKHVASSTLARKAVDGHHMTREGFREKYSLIMGKDFPKDLKNKIAVSEAVRDKILHGKSVAQGEVRAAILSALEYIQGLNEEVHSRAAFKPFGRLKGFKGRATSLDDNTTRWMLKGMGFAF